MAKISHARQLYDWLVKGLEYYADGSAREAPEAAAIARWLMEDVNIGHQQVLLNDPVTLSGADMQRLTRNLDQLAQHKPVQQVTGYAWFYNRKFRVNDSVLIPRPETEELVHRVIQQLPAREAVNILDIGTGSGCIAITLALEIEQARVWAIDISHKALEKARENASLFHASVSFHKLDVLNYSRAGEAGMNKKPFDVIVSNPPYITFKEQNFMEKEVTAYEPNEALYVSNENPLVFYEAISSFAKHLLISGGQLFVEINEQQGAAVQSLLVSKGYQQVAVFKDLFGKDRIVQAKYTP